MKFAMFYEIPVAKPWGPRSEYEAYQNTIEQAKLGDRMGFHSFWTVEHHFLDEYSHCSNPEVLYGHLSAVTKNLRIGYGVRLLPKPYNHPIRSAESAAVLDPWSDGRVRVRHRPLVDLAEIEAFGLTRTVICDMWDEALATHRRPLDERRVRVRGQALADAPAACILSPLQEAASSDLGRNCRVSTGTTRWASARIGLLSFTVGNPPGEPRERIVNFIVAARRLQAARRQVQERDCRDLHDGALQRHEREGARKRSRKSRSCGRRAPRTSHRVRVAEWMEGRARSSATMAGRGEARKGEQAGYLTNSNMNYLYDSGAGWSADPDRCIEICKRYEAVGCELLFCLLNPYKIPHEKVMQSIELIGKHVIPEFDK